MARTCPSHEGVFNNGSTAQPPAIGELRTASSFTGSATEAKNGDYYVDTAPNILHMRWDDGTWEAWHLTANVAGIQKLELSSASSSLGYTSGVGAGSDAPFSKRVHPVNLPAHPAVSHLPLDRMTQCSTATWVINESHHISNTSSPCSCDPKHSYINNWVARISTTDRRDTWHSWCQCLAFNENCYSRGSHQRMLLQAVDDIGAFRGWVGVQADNGFKHAKVYDLLDL